jgi:uncharacterized protein (DUF1800 family)
VLCALALTPLLLALAASSPAEAGRRRLALSTEHVLNRTGYGLDAWSLSRIEAIGLTAYVEEQLEPESIDDTALQPLLAQFPSLEMSYLQLYVSYGGQGQPLASEVLHDIQRARILRAVASRRQLQEVLVDFWFNHFNVYVANAGYWDISPYERLVIRPHVLGSFEDMLLGVAISPAMLIYLDNHKNQVGSLNENYARELLELHTLGVGNYTENDIVEAARCLTGWRHEFNGNGSVFHPELHDQGAKSLLGTLQIPANGGSQDIVNLIHFLATHPATAAHISRKLAVRFVSEDPPQTLVDRAAAVFLDTGGDLRAVTESILGSPEFRNSASRTKVKRPLHLLASAARATGADPAQLDLSAMSTRLYGLGEPLYRVRPPTGLPDASASWASPGALLLRFNLMESIARRDPGYVFSYPAAAGVAELVDALVARYFIAGVTPETRNGAIAFGTGLGLPVNAPELAEQATAYLLSSPEFLSH